MKRLRAHVQELREYMFSASSYPGPEPGLGGVVATMAHGCDPYGTLSDEEQKAAEQKRKLADKRARLRKIALWLSRGPQ